MKLPTYPNLRAELARFNITISALADALGISRQALTEKLAKRANFTLADIIKIADFLNEKAGGGLTLDYLFRD